MTISWDQYFMNLTYMVAMRSKDWSTHSGAVIVRPDNSIASTGYNSFPKGIYDHSKSRQERPEKYFWFEHAERNAIYLSRDPSMDGYKIYVNWMPCMDCARGIVQKGIKEVIVDGTNNPNPKVWAKHNSKVLELFFLILIAKRRSKYFSL